MIEVRLAGIPATLELGRCLVVKGNDRADNDWDYHGYAEIEYTVCDRRGRPAPWLERKMTVADRERADEAALVAVMTAREEI